jgi:3-dehydroquinate synthase
MARRKRSKGMVNGNAVPAGELRQRDAIPLPGPGARIEARATRSDIYPILVVRTNDDAVSAIVELVGDAQVALVTDDAVLRLYGRRLQRELEDAGIRVDLSSMPPGEESKSLRQASRLWDWLAESSVGRRDVVVTLGGGVVNDLGGWVASVYMRGLPYLNVPTTLLGQVDGALGGKVAANHPIAKNLLGAFHQPRGVVSNVGFLASLDDRHLRAGLAESIKKAVIASPAYWSFISDNAEAIVTKDPVALEALVRYASAIKSTLIQRDPYEEDLRRPLNFGHTIGHPLETVTGYGRLLHGEAVAVGMVVESYIANARGLLSDERLRQLIELLERVGLPTGLDALQADVDDEAVLRAMDKVRLIRAGSLRYVLPVALGETVIADDVAADEVRRALARARHAVAMAATRPA